jgi:hypothetical protein
MGELGAIDENVKFDWAKATELAGALRSAANVLDYQVGERRRITSDPTEHWRGRYAEEFGRRLSTCVGDAGRFVTSLREAARRLDEMARLARNEQDRREQAREWVRDNEGGVLDAIGDFVFGDDKPPPPPPVTPPTIPIEAPVTTTRDLV